MSVFTMMVGIPASGKSHLANKLSSDDAVVLSSDDIRIELFDNVSNQKDNSIVFDVMNERANRLLSQGKDVIYDATNINRRRRRHLINHVIKADKKIVYYMSTDLVDSIYRNKNRKRRVSEDVIKRMYTNLHIPVKNEGWDKVIYTPSENKEKWTGVRGFCEKAILNNLLDHDDLFLRLSFHLVPFNSIYNLPHDSSYHSFSVSRHTYHVYKYIMDNYKGENKLALLWASLFHDTGKAFCKSFTNHKGENTKYARFIRHENVSAQITAYYLGLMGYDDEFVKSVVKLVQFHMYPMRASEKTMRSVKGLIGDRLYSKLLVLHEADTLAK